MPREILCVYCEKPLLDVEHAKKHVLEKCPKAPWRARIAEFEERNTRLNREVTKAKLVNEALGRQVAYKDADRLALRAANTPLEGAVRSAVRLLGRYEEYHREQVVVLWHQHVGERPPKPSTCGCALCVEARDLTILGKQLLKYRPVDGTPSDSAAIRKLGPDERERIAAFVESLDLEHTGCFPGSLDATRRNIVTAIRQGFWMPNCVCGQHTTQTLEPVGGPEHDRGAAALRPVASFPVPCPAEEADKDLASVDRRTLPPEEPDAG